MPRFNYNITLNGEFEANDIFAAQDVINNMINAACSDNETTVHGVYKNLNLVPENVQRTQANANPSTGY